MERPNKRLYERHDAQMPIWARPIGNCEDFTLVETSNISAGGLLFQLDIPMEPGAWLELRFELPQNKDLISSTAIIRHVIKEDDQHYLVGVQFVDVKNYSIPVLMAYLEALYKP